MSDNGDKIMEDIERRLKTLKDGVCKFAEGVTHYSEGVMSIKMEIYGGEGNGGGTNNP